MVRRSKTKTVEAKVDVGEQVKIENESSEEAEEEVKAKIPETSYNADAVYRGLLGKLNSEYFGTPPTDFFYGRSID